MEMLRNAIEGEIAASQGEVAVYYRDLGSSDSLLLGADLRMHAASTMKVPVMIQLFADAHEGLLRLEDSLPVKTSFSSIVDGSPYELRREDDSDTSLYDAVGQKVSLRHLTELMITVSSNLATNLLVERVGAERVTATMRSLGADSIQVLRGVEDGPAFRAGLSNTTTARDLGVVLAALGREEMVSPAASREMLEIMSRQQFGTKIPARLPDGIRIAHKTGRITGISHDAGIVFPEGLPAYVVVILTRGFESSDTADSVAARISRILFDHHLDKHGG